MLRCTDRDKSGIENTLEDHRKKRLERTLRGHLLPLPPQGKINYTYDIPDRHLSNLFLKKTPAIEILQPL